MSELLLSGHTTLHDIPGGSPQFVGNVHIQSNDGDFLYALPSQKDLDDGKIQFLPSKQGYAMITIRKPGGPTTVALKAMSTKPVSARIWADSTVAISPVPQVDATDVFTPDAPARGTAKKPKKNRNLSILLWIALLLIAVYFLSKAAQGSGGSDGGSSGNDRLLKTFF